MSNPKILFISGSIGLGHVTRDLAIARELRVQYPQAEISWLAAHPASQVIEEKGETLLPEAAFFANDNISAEQAAETGYRLNLLNYLLKAKGTWKQNVEVFRQVVEEKQFDLIVADEAYEIKMALSSGKVQIDIPFVMIYDFIGNASVSWNPLEKLGTYLWNRKWARFGDFFHDPKNIALFIGQPEDIPDTRLGFRLPNRRELAIKVCHFVGYVLPFDPADYADRAAIRARLGYGQETLIICSIGGTSVGKDLLELCGQAFPIIQEKIPDARMILVCGPRLSPDLLNVPEGVEIKGYLPALYEHFAACDLAIIQSGNTSILELTALRRPFICFPLKGHFEQELYLPQRLARHQSGVRMHFSRTTPEILAEAVIKNLNTEPTWPAIPTDGAKKAAEAISRLLQNFTQN